ncbi:plasmid stabilization system protein ParE [Sphingomonas sp. BE123]|jgi:plasmid stabilization system protein ParE|uniref:hypothetical protein n=1 Tax=unclassified Sphingomonas TaxID=196159 RepID=UPI002860103A|nr:hypothetical protein [Sphingomonas sp. BE123]MDR6850913.1 plasmid stabilization system protein ParE [Sphingomonas sp. BE123]
MFADEKTLHRAGTTDQPVGGRCEQPPRFSASRTPCRGGRRELATVLPYVIRYLVMGQRVFINDIKHGRQRRE